MFFFALISCTYVAKRSSSWNVVAQTLRFRFSGFMREHGKPYDSMLSTYCMLLGTSSELALRFLCLEFRWYPIESADHHGPPVESPHKFTMSKNVWWSTASGAYISLLNYPSFILWYNNYNNQAPKTSRSNRSVLSFILIATWFFILSYQKPNVYNQK